MLINYRKKGQ